LPSFQNDIPVHGSHHDRTPELDLAVIPAPPRARKPAPAVQPSTGTRVISRVTPQRVDVHSSSPTPSFDSHVQQELSATHRALSDRHIGSSASQNVFTDGSDDEGMNVEVGIEEDGKWEDNMGAGAEEDGDKEDNMDGGGEEHGNDEDDIDVGIEEYGDAYTEDSNNDRARLLAQAESSPDRGVDEDEDRDDTVMVHVGNNKQNRIQRRRPEQAVQRINHTGRVSKDRSVDPGQARKQTGNLQGTIKQVRSKAPEVVRTYSS